jgi:pyruvate/2-oxoglutarate dehydrogenase complex dihydrolipoamide dehydrogenase (E3) component
MASGGSGSAERFDLIVVGGGAAGLVTAAGSAGLGARVALVERERMGGECLWTGCVPSKALLACGKAAHHARAAARFGVHAEPRVDFAGAMRWVHAARDTIAPHDSPERFRGLGVDVLQGEARFVGDRTLDVDGRRITAKRVVVATGSRPAIPNMAGLDVVPYLTNESVFELADQPSHLIILGAGPVGIELAQAFARLGTRVTVVETASALLPREEPELAAMLGDVLAREGIVIHLGTTAIAARRTDTGVALTARGDDGGVMELDGSHLLVATGRTSQTNTLDLAAGGVEVDKNGVKVDEQLRTTAKGVWACGDCIGGPRLTHVADYQARLVIRNAFFPLKGKADYSTIPWVTYTDPELAHVGKTEADARWKHHEDVRVWTRAFADVDRAIADGIREGMVKLVTRGDGTLLGGHILGTGAGDMIGEIALAVKLGLNITALGSLVHAYPSMPEAIRQAAEQFNKARFTGPARRIAGWFARR